MTVLYMVVSLRLTPNLENAVSFAAENLRGPIGRDLKRMMWDLSTGRYLNAEELLDELRRCAQGIGRNTITIAEFEKHQQVPSMHNSKAIWLLD